MNGWSQLLKEHTVKIVLTAVVSLIVGGFFGLMKVPADIVDLSKEVAELNKRVSASESNEKVLRSRINYHDRDINRLTNEHFKDSVAQRYIIETLNDIKILVKQNNSDFKRFEDGYYNRIK